MKRFLVLVLSAASVAASPAPSKPPAKAATTKAAQAATSRPVRVNWREQLKIGMTEDEVAAVMAQAATTDSTPHSRIISENRQGKTVAWTIDIVERRTVGGGTRGYASQVVGSHVAKLVTIDYDPDGKVEGIR